MENYTRNYMLAIRRHNNDYLPLEFNLTKEYEGENLNTLEGIDSFTTKCEDFELIDSIIDDNIVDPNERFEDFVIIYYEKSKCRELKEGPIFKKDENILNIEYVTRAIVSLLDDKSFMNHIYNLKDKFSSESTLELIYLLKNTNVLYSLSSDSARIIASLINSMPYEDRRIIGYIVYNKINSISKAQEMKKSYKNVA